MLEEVRQTFDLRANVYFIVADNSTNTIGSQGRSVLGIGGRTGKNNGFVMLPPEFNFHTLSHEMGHAFGLEHDFHDGAYVMSYGVGGVLSECSAGFLAVHPYFSPDSPIEEAPPPSIEIISPQAYPTGSESVPVQLGVSDPEGLHQVILFATTIGPHPANGFLEVHACQGLAGTQDAVAEFDYDGTIPSIHGESLSNPSVHSMYAKVVDTDGNVGEKSILLSETSPNHIATLEGHTQEVTSVSFSPDGTILASASQDYTIRLWDVSMKKNIAILEKHEAPVSSVSFSPDGDILASAAWFPDNTIRLWDLQTEEDAILERGPGASSVSFSPDGTILAAGSSSTRGTVDLWDVIKRTRIATLEGHIGPIRSLSFSYDGTILASGSDDGAIRLWDVATEKNIATLRLDPEQPVSSASFSPDGAMLASTYHDESIRLWNVATEENATIFPGHKRWVTSVSFSPDGTILASGSIDATVKLWDLEREENIGIYTGNLTIGDSRSIFLPS